MCVLTCQIYHSTPAGRQVDLSFTEGGVQRQKPRKKILGARQKITALCSNTSFQDPVRRPIPLKHKYLPGGMVVAIAVESATLNYIVFNRLTSFYFITQLV